MNTSININGYELTPIYPEYQIRIECEISEDSSLATPLLPSEPIGWRISMDTIFLSSPPKESFIGVLSDKEAEKMEERIKSFRKSFADDLARRNKGFFSE